MTDSPVAHEARIPTEIDQIAEDWVTTLAELDPSIATWIGIPGKLDEYEDLSPAGHHTVIEEGKMCWPSSREPPSLTTSTGSPEPT